MVEVVLMYVAACIGTILLMLFFKYLALGVRKLQRKIGGAGRKREERSAGEVEKGKTSGKRRSKWGIPHPFNSKKRTANAA